MCIVFEDTCNYWSGLIGMNAVIKKIGMSSFCLKTKGMKRDEILRYVFGADGPLVQWLASKVGWEAVGRVRAQHRTWPPGI
jgi:hypothetical protein